MIQLAKPLSLVLFVVIAGGFASDAAAQRIRLEAQMGNVANEVLASGKARYEWRASRVKFTCEVEDLAVTETIVVFANGFLMGAAPVNDLGTADLNLDSRFQDVNIPEMNPGFLIEVFNENGDLIMQGVLQDRR